MSNNNPIPLHITMLGARGVGKTSLLASVYEQFDRQINDVHLQLLADFATSRELTDRLSMLKSAMANVIVTGLHNTGEMRTFNFGLGLPTRKPAINLTFRDYPGALVSTNPDEVAEYIRSSDVIVWAIDTTALMANKGKYSELINSTSRITDFFKHALEDLPQNQCKLILLVPIKCETWIAYPQYPNYAGIDEMCNLIESKWKSFVDYIKKIDPDSQRFSIALTPVQTLGNVKYTYTEENDGSMPSFVFARTSKEHPYQPKDVEQVLYYSLTFLLRRYIDVKRSQMSWSDWLRYRVREFFRKETNIVPQSFGKAAIDLVDKQERDEKLGFKILHGKRLLDKPSV